MRVGEPWERIGVDITGPHPPSAKGNRYILTCIDHFSKWVEVFPMRNQEATTVARLLVDKVFCTHGMPIQLLTDQGANFESQLFKEVCRLMGIDKIRTSAYRPSTNGNIERFHGTLNAMLAKWISSNQRDWDDKLPAVAFAYRTSIHDTTGFTPYYLLHGREARAPADLVYGTAVDATNETYCDFVEQREDTMRRAYELVREHLGVMAERRKDRYDMRTRPHKYPAGTWVWYFVPRRRQGRSHKWESFGQGPFLVVQELGPVTVVIQRSEKARRIVTHIEKLKPCCTEGLRSWLTSTPEPDASGPDPAGNPPPTTSTSANAPNLPAPPTGSRPQREHRRPARYCAAYQR
jgi:hypothetical protein